MQINSICNEIVSATHSSVINIVFTNTGDLDYSIPKNVAGRQSVDLWVFEYRRHPMQQRPPRCVLRSRLEEPYLGVGSELTVHDRLADQRFSYLVPHICGHGVRTGTTYTCYKLLEYKLGRFAPRTVDANLGQESRLVFRPVYPQVPAVAVTRLAHPHNPALNTETKQ